MKKLSALTALILLLTAFAGHSQTTDTVCLPTIDAKRVLTRLERLKVDSVAGQLSAARVNDLQALTASQDQAINNLRSQVSTEQLRASNYQLQVTGLQSALRKQKRKTVLAVIGGILTSGGLVYLMITR